MWLWVMRIQVMQQFPLTLQECHHKRMTVMKQEQRQVWVTTLMGTPFTLKALYQTQSTVSQQFLGDIPQRMRMRERKPMKEMMKQTPPRPHLLNRTRSREEHEVLREVTRSQVNTERNITTHQRIQSMSVIQQQQWVTNGQLHKTQIFPWPHRLTQQHKTPRLQMHLNITPQQME